MNFVSIHLEDSTLCDGCENEHEHIIKIGMFDYQFCNECKNKYFPTQ